jgi:hypothetical protein
MPYLPIDTGYYESSVKPIANQQLVNWYVDAIETESVTKAQLLPTPGLAQLFNTGDTEINRGAINVGGKPYFINGNQLYRINQTFDFLGDEVLSIEALGTIAGTERVSVATSGDQICIVVPGAESYVFTTSTDTLTQITDAAFLSLGSSVKVTYIDGYFIHVSSDKRTVFNSALNNGLSYNALDFAEAESDPDSLVSCHSFSGKLFLFGETTTEVWQNTGSLGFPFQRVYVVPVGIAARESIANFDVTFGFVGQDVGGQPSVYAFDGNGFAKISHGAIDSILERLSPADIANGFAFNYSEDGAIFYGVSFKTNTFVYDARSSRIIQKKLWHERFSVNLDQKTRWRVNSLIQAYGRYFVGDSENGIIGVMSLNEPREYGAEIRREFVCGPFKEASGPIFWKKLELMVNSGQQQNAQVRMSYSDNGGYTWSYEQWRSAGAIGQYGRQVTWNRLGRSLNSRMFKFEYSDPYKLAVIGLIGEFSGGRQ